MSHSKRNTSLAFFTSHERAQLRNSWGSQEARLVRDSFLPFASCCLCLLRAKDPVVCAGDVVESLNDGENSSSPSDYLQNGRRRQQCHLFCRECAMSNLLAQRQEFKRHEKIEKVQAAVEGAKQSQNEHEAIIRAVSDFEQVQSGIPSRYNTTGDSGITVPSYDRNSPETESGASSRTHPKRKVDLAGDNISQLEEEDRVKARRKLEHESARASKPLLPSFWVPSLTPDRQISQEAPHLESPTDPKLRQQTVCPCSSDGTSHSMSLKSLIDVHFTREKGVSGDADTRDSTTDVAEYAPICPACSRLLSNSSHAMLARACGHVLCGSCTDKFVFQPQQTVAIENAAQAGQTASCFVCDVSINDDSKAKRKRSRDKSPRGLVEICSDGTGFARGGKSFVKKDGVAFQC